MESRYRVYCDRLSFEGDLDSTLEKIKEWYADKKIKKNDIIRFGGDDLLDRYKVYCGELSFEGTQDECVEKVNQWYLDGEIDSSDLITGLDDELADELFHYFLTHSDDL